MKRLKPEKITGIRIKGIITDSEEDKWFTFDFRPKNRDFREELRELRSRYQKIEKGKKEDKRYFRQAFRGARVHLIYLNWESAKGLYKNPKHNLPYEILSEDGRTTLYRQSINRRKEDIFNELEKAAIKEGLRED